MNTCWRILLTIALLWISAHAAPGEPAAAPANRFENQVRLYEAQDKTNPPPRNAILLAGDSQFYRWNTLHDDLPGYTIINRGIDSFQTTDLLHFADRLVLPYQPRMIILHIGGNDVHGGKTAEEVLANFKAFVAKVRAVQPTVPIAFSSMTPGPGRWDEADRRKAANQLIKSYIATQRWKTGNAIGHRRLKRRQSRRVD